MEIYFNRKDILIYRHCGHIKTIRPVCFVRNSLKLTDTYSQEFKKVK